MNKDSESEKQKLGFEIKPVSKRLMRLYAFLAIIIVIIPEFLAETTISLFNINGIKNIKSSSPDWQRDPELRLSRLTFQELRILAQSLGVREYTRDTKHILYKKLLRKLSK